MDIQNLETPTDLSSWLLHQARRGGLPFTKVEIEAFLGKFTDDIEATFAVTFFDDVDDYIETQGEDYFLPDDDFDEDDEDDDFDNEEDIADLAEEDIANDDFLFYLVDGSLINFAL